MSVFGDVFSTNFVGAFEFLPQLKYGKSNQLHAANVGFLEICVRDLAFFRQVQ